MYPINAALDLYSILISLILISCRFFNRRRKYSTCLLLMCVFNLGMLLGDLPNWLCEGSAAPLAGVLLRVGTVLYFACSAPLLLFFTGYIAEYLRPRVLIHKAFWHVACVLCAVQLLCSALSPWNGMFFTIAPGNIYQRGPWFWLSQAIPFCLYFINLVLITTYRAHLNRRERVFFYAYLVLPLAAETIQMLHYGIALMNTACTLALLLVYVNIQMQRDLDAEQQERMLTNSRIDIMLSQIQPHFLYNTLTAIQQLCDKDPAQAKESILVFSRFLRGNMNALSSKSPILFEQELTHVRNYLALEQQRFGPRLQVHYAIGAQDFTLPPLTLQPIVENAVRHGVLRREEGGAVTISSWETADADVIEVADNGVGFQPPSDDRLHIGIENVRGRLSALCGGRLTIESMPDQGTTVTITLPKERNQP